MRLVRLILFVGLLLASTESTFAKAWRELVPMKSTRADVERLLGTAIVDSAPNRYELAEETVYVEYVRYPCDLKPPQGCATPPPVCALPPDTVLSITVRLGRPVPLSSLHLDLSKFEKEPDDHHTGRLFFYWDHERGFSIHVLDGAVVAYGYHPTNEDEKLFRCSSVN